MSLILSLGSNQGNRLDNLNNAELELLKIFTLVKKSRIYHSKAVDYLNQPDFYNQVFEFLTPKNLNPKEIINLILEVETKLGRKRSIPKGPRIIDIDYIFHDFIEINDADLILPHPAWLKRSFIVRPFSELPFFQEVTKCFKIPSSFEVEAHLID